MTIQPPSTEARRPQRVAAQVGDAKRKLAVDSSSESEDSDASFGGSRGGRKRSLVAKRLSSIGKAGTVPTIRKGPIKSIESSQESLSRSVHLTPAKRLRTSSSALSSSSLSSLSSDTERAPAEKRRRALEDRRKPFESPLPTSPPAIASSSQRKARRRSEPVRPTTSMASTVSPLPSSSQTRTTSSSLVLLTPFLTQTDEWRLDDVTQPQQGVFVKLTSAPGPDSRINDAGVMWWPATVTSNSREVSLPVGTSIRIIPITSPSHCNIVSLLDPTTGQPRFNVSDYYCGAIGRRDLHVNKLWSEAMKDVAGEESDDNSLMDISDHPQPGSDEVTIDDRPRLKRQLAEMQLEEARELIGQKVLSLTKEGGLYYWPGTVNEVSLRERIGTTIRYEVEFWNGDSTKVPRRCLYTAEDPQFYTCQMGPRQAYATPQSKTQDPFQPPACADDFAALSLHAQLTFVQPVLLAIIRDEYPPAREFVDRFYTGCDMKEEQRFGGMDPEEIIEVVRGIFLGGSHTVDNVAAAEGQYEKCSSSAALDSGTPLGAAGTPDAAGNLYASRPQDGGPARLTGSQRYEELPPKQRLMFCTDVLVTQTALQLTLWRTGARTVPSLLSSEEETSLYEKGRVLLEDPASSDDVYACIERLRKERKAFLGRSVDGDTGTRVLVGGTSTRPKWKMV